MKTPKEIKKMKKNKNLKKWQLYLYGDLIFESDDILTVEAYKNKLTHYSKKNAIIQQNTFIK